MSTGAEGPAGGRRVRGRRAVVAVLAAVLVGGPVAVAVVAGAPDALGRLDLASGAAWLASPTQGIVTLVDGPSEQVVASVGTGAVTGTPVSVTQRGSTAYVVDDVAGTVLRVDGATFEAGVPTVFGSGGGGLRVIAPPVGDATDLYVLDPDRRTAQVVDAGTLAVRSELSLGAEPGSDQSVVDADGRLWAVDSGGRGLTWVDGSGHDGAGGQGRADAAGTDRVVLVQGLPALVDVDDGRVGRLDDDGRVDDWSCLDVQPDDDVRLLGSGASASVFAAVSGTGTLLRAGLDGDDCGDVVGVGAPGDAFGDLAESDRFVLVPNWGTGTTYVVDTRAGEVVAQFPLSDPGNRVELLPRDGLVFYNDLDSERAGVLSFDGATWTAGEALQKYDPADPTGGVVEPLDDDAPVTVTPPADAPDDSDPGSSPQVPPTGGSPRTPPVVPPTGPPSTGRPGGTPVPGGTTIPVVQDITVAPTPSPGASVTFTAAVANPSGAWSWTVLDGADVLTTSTAEGSLAVDVPASAVVGDVLTVRLGVGSSAVVTRTFPVGLVATTVVVTVNKPTAGAGEPVTTTVVVTSAGGGTPSGEVELVFDVPLETPRQQPFESMPLVGGAAEFNRRQFPDPGQTVTAQVTYTPDDGVHAPSSGSTTIQVVDSCRIVVDGPTQIDVRQSSSSESVTVRFADCGTIPALTWTVAPWLATFGGGGGLDVFTTVSQQSDPPADGSNPGAVVASIPNGSSVSFDVLGSLPPRLVTNPACEQVTGGVSFTVGYGPAVEVSLSMTGLGREMAMIFPVADGGYYQVVVPTAELPNVSSWSTVAQNQYGRNSAPATTPRGSCW